jgi:hypothetical protein
MVATPISARVEDALLGSFKSGSKVSFDVPGGTAQGVRVIVDHELAPDIGQLRDADRLVVAGEVIDGALQPYFMYAFEVDGTTLRSLLESASENEPVFTIDELRSALNNR